MAEQESAAGTRINGEIDCLIREIESKFQKTVSDCKEKLSVQLSAIQSSATEEEKSKTGSIRESIGTELENLLVRCCCANKGRFLHLLEKCCETKGTLPEPLDVKNILSSKLVGSSNMDTFLVDFACQTDLVGQDDKESDNKNIDAPKLKQLSEEFENYKKDVENIIQVKLKGKEEELEEKFKMRMRQLESVETCIHEKLSQSEHHANCLHAALKSAIVELSNLKNKIEECSFKSSPRIYTPVDLRFVQTNSEDFTHLNGNHNEVHDATSNSTTSQLPNGSPDTARAKLSTMDLPQQLPGLIKRPSATNCDKTCSSSTDAGASAAFHSRCSSADNVSKSDTYSFATRPPSSLTAKVPFLSTPHPFLLNLKYPPLTDPMLASYFNSALFCVPQPVSSLASPSAVATTLSPSQYIIPSNINPFKKLSAASNLSTSPPEVKPRVPFPAASSLQNIPKLISMNTSASQITQVTHVSSSPSTLSSYPHIDAFQPTKLEPLDVNSPDTAEIAQRVRDILSAHNIGQRQFAREVLGLSQGTVSELLSKPKPWEKLTEKGRESYRKMLAWTQEENNYLELKMSSYKNGQNNVMQPPSAPTSSFTSPSSSSSLRPDEASSTEMRISQILMQAQAAIHNQASLNRPPKLDVKANGDTSHFKMRSNQRTAHSKDAHGPVVACRSSVSEYDNNSRRSEYQGASNDSLNFVTRIYREQLLELLKTAEKNKNQAEIERYRAELIRISSQPPPSSSSSSSSSFTANNNTLVDSTGINSRDEVKKEPVERSDLDYINRSSCPSDGPEDLSFAKNKGTPIKLVNCKEEPKSPESLNGDLQRLLEASSNDSSNSNLLQHSSSFNADQISNKTADAFVNPASPLKQMQSITNSIVNTASSSVVPPSTSHSFPHQHITNTRVALPSLDQEMWEKCANLNTDDIVQRVKELLSEYCISQRLFGEHVLGLSQGSVSDLLARPKPWYMLTHKGREPFVRMKCFLDEPQSVHNLVSNQYKVPADKLLRVSIFASSSSNVAVSTLTSTVVPTSESSCQGRKRKSSASLFEEESNNVKSDSEQSGVSTLGKKNRISFTDDQKKLLKLTYKKDPYPLHSTIEQLASTLDVGVKTVVNWFHNHRMRDKSRFTPVNTWDQNMSSDSCASTHVPQDGNYPTPINFTPNQIKSEDQSSQSCDSSSDFFLYFCNNNNNNVVDNRQEVCTNLSTTEKFSLSEMNQDETGKHNHVGEGEEASEPDEGDDSSERQKREMKVVSKRKSARPQKMSSHYVADKSVDPHSEVYAASTSEMHADDNENPTQSSESATSLSTNEMALNNNINQKQCMEGKPAEESSTATHPEETSGGEDASGVGKNMGVEST